MNRGYSSAPRGFQFDSTPVIVGAVLMGAGAVLCLTGVIIGGRALLSATDRWLGDLEVPPTEAVRQKWDQTKAAATAGARAWQHHDGAPARRGHS